MYQIDFSRPVHVHFIGIGGISMSGLAQILLTEGFTVSGSDLKRSPLTDQLAAMGAQIALTQTAGNIHPGIDAAVYTAAVHPDNPEFAAAEAAGIPMLTRAQLLGEVMRNYAMPVAVAGTHGKTTTTSMLSLICLEAGQDPTISVGGILKDIGGNIRLGNSDIFVAEACEYTDSFLSLAPRLGIILNIDADHLDYFKNLAHIRDSFHRFASLLPQDGTLVLPADLEDYEGFVKDLACRVVSFGIDRGDFHAADIHYNDNGCGRFTLIRRGEPCGEFILNIPGEHNVFNAVAALAAADTLGADVPAMQRGLSRFAGADRRFQVKGSLNGAMIVDDYAHHPTEIKATLKAAKNVPHREIWCVFQPHTFTRTKKLMKEFAEALALADHVILAKIYPAREKDDLGISSDTLRERMATLGADVCYLDSFEEIKARLRSVCAPGDLILTMGAGDVVQIGDDLAAGR